METVKSIHDLTKDNFKKAVIVFTEDSFENEYSEKSRSYEIDSSAKFFNANMGGNSLFGQCLDGTEIIRLDNYLFNNGYDIKLWNVEKIYITEK